MLNLLDHIERFLSETGTKPTTFGRECMNDPGFVFDLRNGRAFTSTTADKVTRFIDAKTRDNTGAAA
jgi:hypothetical protein